MSGRPWTIDEELVVRATRLMPARVAAQRLGRTVMAINGRRGRLGLSRPTPRGSRAELARLRAMNAEQYTDTEIAAELGRPRHTVNEWRRLLRLPSHKLGARRVAAVAVKTAAQCRAAGVANLGELRQAVFAERARAAGWPGECTPIMVEVLEQLKAGPRTKRELCHAMGRRYHRCKALTTTGGVGVLWALKKLGLVEYCGRRPFAPGKGKTEWVYALTPAAERHVAAREELR